MAAVKVDRKGPLPARRHRLRHGFALLVLLQAPAALAEPMAMDAQALTSGSMAGLGARAMGGGLEGAGPQVICEQLRGHGAERCRPVSRLAPVGEAPGGHRPRGTRVPSATQGDAPPLAEDP